PAQVRRALGVNPVIDQPRGWTDKTAAAVALDSPQFSAGKELGKLAVPARAHQCDAIDKTGEFAERHDLVAGIAPPYDEAEARIAPGAGCRHAVAPAVPSLHAHVDRRQVAELGADLPARFLQI